MDSTAPVSPRLLLTALILGAVPALAATIAAPELLQRWDLPITAGVLVGALLLARRRSAERVPEFPFAFGLAVVIALVVPTSLHLSQPVPPTNDERAYLYQAELFAEGKLSEALQLNELVDFTLRRRQVHEDQAQDLRYAKYPPGTSLWLTPGAWIGWPALMAVSSALCSVLLARSLARQYGLPHPGTLALLLALSPFFVLVQSGFQSEIATLPAALLAWWALLKVREGASRYAVLVGLACGLVFLARPLTGVVAALACGVGLLQLGGGAAARVRAIVAATLGGLPVLALMLAYQAAQTGEALLSPYHAYAQAFGPWEDASLAPDQRVPIDVYGNGDLLAGIGRQAARWSVGLGMLGAAALGFLGLWRLRARDGGAAFVFAVGLPLAYSLHWYPGHWAYLGPLYGYESLALLLIGFVAMAAAAPPAWGRNLVLALAAWGAIATVPRFGLIQEQVQLRSAPERVAATLPDDSVLLLPFVAVPSMQEFGMKHWTPSRHPAAERVAIIRELPRADHMLRALDALGLGGRPVYRLSPRTDAQAGEPDYEALPAPDLSGS
ncbi:MAG: hypothetical protein CMJ94_15580 [Planctomycetes bacterium]|nr:hypothetical protein [Planctomycetota bacterium]